MTEGIDVELRGCALTSKGGQVRLESTSVTFPAAQITAVVGPNGAGKSSLLGIAAGTLVPSEGNVLFDGTDISIMNARELGQSRAVLAQDLSVAFGFSVADVVSWGRTPWRGSEQQKFDQFAIESALERVGVRHLASRAINELSGGERKRVHLARVLAQNTRCVVMDEPDSDLDLTGIASLDSTISDMQSDGTTLIVTSHDLARISRIAQWMVVVASHRIIATGDVRSVMTTEILSEAYGTRVEVYWNDRGIAEISTVY